MTGSENYDRDEKRALDAFVKLLRAAETVASNTQRHLAKSGVTPSQFGVLEALFHLGPLNQKVIGQKILKSSGNITMVIGNLERLRLVNRRREEVDRRYIIVELTPEGRTLIEPLFRRQKAEIVAEMSILSPEELELLSRLCRKLGLKQSDAKVS